MTRDTLDILARELAKDVTLPAEDWEAIVTQSERMLALIKPLDELPLDAVEPASVYHIQLPTS